MFYGLPTLEEIAIVAQKNGISIQKALTMIRRERKEKDISAALREADAILYNSKFQPEVR